MVRYRNIWVRETLKQAGWRLGARPAGAGPGPAATELRFVHDGACCSTAADRVGHRSRRASCCSRRCPSRQRDDSRARTLPLAGNKPDAQSMERRHAKPCWTPAGFLRSCSMRSRIPQPCIAPSDTVFRISMSRLPCKPRALRARFSRRWTTLVCAREVSLRAGWSTADEARACASSASRPRQQSPARQVPAWTRQPSSLPCGVFRRSGGLFRRGTGRLPRRPGRDARGSAEFRAS